MEDAGMEIAYKSNLSNLKGSYLVLRSLNCEKYISTFENYGINEHTMLHLTANDLRYMGVDENDIITIMTALNALHCTSEDLVLLSDEDVSKIQSNIHRHLEAILVRFNSILYVITSENFEDSLIDDHLSSIDAALMLKPFLRAEEKEMKTILEKGLKRQNKMKIVLITSAACAICLCGLAFRHWNFSFNCNTTFSTLTSQIQIWKK